MALTDVANIESWIKRDIEADREAELTRCCSAATKILEQITGRTLERVTKTQNFDGYLALGIGDEIYLHPGHRPVLHTGSDLITCTVSGLGISVVTGYSTTAGIVAIGANEDRPVMLKRLWGPFIWGIQNIAVSYKCGWQTNGTTDSQPVPDDVVQLANEVAWLMFQSPDWLGKQNVSNAGAAISIANALSPIAQHTLDRLTVII